MTNNQKYNNDKLNHIIKWQFARDINIYYYEILAFFVSFLETSIQQRPPPQLKYKYNISTKENLCLCMSGNALLTTVPSAYLSMNLTTYIFLNPLLWKLDDTTGWQTNYENCKLNQ